MLTNGEWEGGVTTPSNPHSLEGDTHTGHNTEAWCAGARTDLPDIGLIRCAAQSGTALQFLQPLLLLKVRGL